jgi:hypothetical protein
LLATRGSLDAIFKYARTDAMADVGMLALIMVVFGLAAGYARLCGALSPPADGSREIDQ